ncbi:MAG: hypothetical protein ACREI7_07125, partial [Myxococcota bacterium]
MGERSNRNRGAAAAVCANAETNCGRTSTAGRRRGVTGSMVATCIPVPELELEGIRSGATTITASAAIPAASTAA